MAQKRLQTFAPNLVTVVITHNATGAVHEVGQFSEDTIVSIARNSETFTMYRGADDSKTRVYNADTSATITLPLQQTSNSNDFLQYVYEYDRARLNSDGLFSILIKDNSGRSVFFSDEAYIGVVPDASFANSMQLREWVIHAPEMVYTLGGNARFDSADAAAIAVLGGTVEAQWQP